MQENKSNAAPAASASASDGVRVKRSVVRVLIFSIISPFYGLYWFYVTRQAATKELNASDNVGLQTVGLIVPILNIFILYWLYRDIDKLHRQAGLSGFSAGGYIGLLVAAGVLGWIPFLGWAIAIAAAVVFFIVVSKLNEYWDKKTNGKAAEAKVTGGEIAVVAIGVIFMVLFLALGVLAAIFGSDTNNIQPINNYSY